MVARSKYCTVFVQVISVISRFRDLKKIYEDEKKYGFGFLQTK